MATGEDDSLMEGRCECRCECRCDYDRVQVSGQRDAGKCSAVQLVTVTLPPPPGRRIPCRNCNTGEGGGCPGGLKGHGDRAGGLQGSARYGTNEEQGARAAMADQGPP